MHTLSRLIIAFTLLLATGVARAQVPAPTEVFFHDAGQLRALDLAQPSNTTRVWDTLHALSAVQGIVNRDSPRLVISYCREYGINTDQFWLDWLRNEDGWLSQASLVSLESLDAIVSHFRDDIEGVVVYDPVVPATSCAASTAAGCEDLIPVRFSREPDSVYRLLTEKLGLPVKLWLVHPDGSSMFTGQGTLPDSDEPSSGSAKVDVYRWAIARYIRPGSKCDTRYAAYYIDAFWMSRPNNASFDMHTLTNYDYFVSKRAFFFDLSPWGDEPPVDDPLQTLGLDKQTLLSVLAALQRAAPESIIKIGGFPPWPFKYTTHGGSGKHEGVPTEWEFTRLISQFNAYHEADAASLGGIANASFMTHYPLADRYPQPNPQPTRSQWQAAGHVNAEGKLAAKLFVGHYVGDYDSPAWLYKAVPAFFSDDQRGQVPLAWAFDPNLADRAPQALVYAYQHATKNDFFIAGDSGAGYLNPRALTVRPDSKLPSGLALWQTHNQRYYDRWGMTITGFMLDGSAGGSTAEELSAYRAFSPDGCGVHYGWPAPPSVIADVATCPYRDLPSSPQAAADFIAEEARKVTTSARFLWARSILKPPSWYAEVSRILREQYPDDRVEVVDPYTFFGLVRFQR